MDMISNLPPNIIETILCFLPIQEAARTSILSKEWRYHWIKIPKLVFTEDTFQVSTSSAHDRTSSANEIIKRLKLFDAIYQVLAMHEDPIHEFTLSMVTDAFDYYNDKTMFVLSRRNIVKKLKLEFFPGYTLALSIFSFHQLTELHLTGCDLKHEPMFSGFANLVSLHIQDAVVSKKALLHLLSSCPLLKSVYLNIDELTLEDGDDSTVINRFERLTLEDSDDSTVVNLFGCLPMIENLSIVFGIIEGFAQYRIPQELPFALVHLKHLCIKVISFIHQYGLPVLVLLIKSSPNLEKLKLEILDDSWVDISERIDSVTLQDDSDIWLEHLNELEIINMIYRDTELDFVKLILARSPVLKKARIFLCNEVAKDEELHISGILKQSPHASPVVEVIVETTGSSHTNSRSVM